MLLQGLEPSPPSSHSLFLPLLCVCSMTVSGPDENLLEVWVVCAEVSPGVLSLGSSSFVLLDFFDYESQVHTSLIHYPLQTPNEQW